MARRPLPILVFASVAVAVLASTAWAAPSDPPAVKKTAQAAGHGPQTVPAPAKKIEPAHAADAHAAPAPKDAHAAPAPKKAEANAPTGHGDAAGSTPAAAHPAPAAPVKKKAKVDRKAIEAEVRQVVTRINAAMQEVASAPAAKPATKATGAGHGTPARVPGKARPSPLLVWDDTLKGGNVTLVWDPELAPRPAGNGARLVWGEDKK